MGVSEGVEAAIEARGLDQVRVGGKCAGAVSGGLEDLCHEGDLLRNLGLPLPHSVLGGQHAAEHRYH